MHTKLTPKDTTRFHPLRLLDAYWHALADEAEGGIPYRASFDPRGVADALPQIALFDRIAPGLAQLRVAGRDWSRLMTRDARGLPLSLLVDAASRPALSLRVAQLFHRPAQITLVMSSARGTVVMRALPLRGHDNRVTQAVAAISVVDRQVTGPLTLTSGSSLPIEPEDLQGDAQGAAAPGRPQRSGGAALRLVVSNGG